VVKKVEKGKKVEKRKILIKIVKKRCLKKIEKREK
tara:strand:- start:5849 stop:5953 length:105 start_codon:yes stop_codon:yes gene_type:complete